MARGKQPGKPAPIDPNDEDLIEAWQGGIEDPIYGLTERERRFGEAYVETALESGNSALVMAYRRAFPLAECSDVVAHRMAKLLIEEPRVIALVTRLRVQLSQRRMQPTERVILDLERIAFSNILDYCSVDPDTGELRVDARRMSHGTAAAVQELTVEETILKELENPNSPGGVIRLLKRKTKLRLYDKLSALDKLARVHGLIKDKNDGSLSIEDLERLIKQYEQKLLERGITIDNEPIGAVSDAQLVETDLDTRATLWSRR